MYKLKQDNLFSQIRLLLLTYFKPPYLVITHINLGYFLLPNVILEASFLLPELFSTPISLVLIY